MTKKIKQVWAYVSANEEDGEGLVAMTFNVKGHQTMFPFVCTDLAMVKKLREHAEKMAKETGKTIKLIRLTQREEVDVIK